MVMEAQRMVMDMPVGQVIRLRTIRGGATVGEVGLYLGTSRTASVIASARRLGYARPPHRHRLPRHPAKPSL